MVDTSDATVLGAWSVRTCTAGSSCVGTTFLNDQNTNKGGLTAIFDLSPPAEGTYFVEVAYSASISRATNVPVSIISADGATSVTLNQQLAPDDPATGFTRLPGSFRFRTTGGSVIISNAGTDGRVIADAVRIVCDGSRRRSVDVSARGAADASLRQRRASEAVSPSASGSGSGPAFGAVSASIVTITVLVVAAAAFATTKIRNTRRQSMAAAAGDADADADAPQQPVRTHASLSAMSDIDIESLPALVRDGDDDSMVGANVAELEFELEDSVFADREVSSSVASRSRAVFSRTRVLSADDMA